MSIDAALLGETAAKCMDGIDADYGGDEGSLIAVGIIAVIEQDNQTFTRTFSSHTRYFEQLGLFSVGLECARSGEDPGGDDDED